jgi:hypothetical protein
VTRTTGVALRVAAGVALLAHAVFAFTGPRQRRQPLLPAAVGAGLLIRGSSPVSGPDELHRQGPTACADRPVVAHPPAAGGHHRRGVRPAAALPGDRAGGGQPGHGSVRAPRAVRPGPAGQVRPGGWARRARSPVRWSGSWAVPRVLMQSGSPTTPPCIGHPAPELVDRRRPGDGPGRIVDSCMREGVTRWKLKNASRY